MTPDLRTVIYPVKDLAQAKTLWGALLGLEPVMDEPYYVQFKEIGLDPHGTSRA